MAEELDVSAITNNYQRGAGDRLGRILEETKPVWMGRMRPIPGDLPRNRMAPQLHESELAAIEAALITALQIIHRAKDR